MPDIPNDPLVSIIVRTKDRPKMLKKALLSIAAQTYRPLEVVLVNDGGCDLDGEELKGILGGITLNYIRLERNTGRANAGNEGIANAKGDYIGFLDDDDEFYAEHVAVLVSVMEQTDHKIVYSDSQMVYKEFDPETYEIRDKKKELLFSQDFDYERLVFENYIPFMCLLFERETLIGSGGFDTNFDLYEDWDLLLRLGKDNPFCHLKKTTADYNQWNSDFQISQGSKNPQFMRQCYIRILSKHIDKVTPDRIHDYMSGYVLARNLVKEKEHLIAEKESLAERLHAVLDQKDARIYAMEGELGAVNARLRAVDVQLRESIFQIREINSRKDRLASDLEDLRMQASDRESLINAMRSTLGWRALEKYRRLRNQFTSGPFSGRIKDSLIIRGLKVLKNKGFRAALGKANKKLLFRKSVKRTFSSIEIPPPSSYAVDENIAASPIASKASVVIPTRNAGPEFDYILRKISQQEGIGEIELIIVDSGSEDRTIDIGGEYTKNIFRIPPGDFHHARTRNFGAGKATGEFLVFTVQDAIPVSNQWLYKLLYPIHQGQASASSARQIPRSDADLFSGWSYWSHNINYLGGDRDCICNNSLFENFETLDLQTKRSMAKLDGVSLGIRKSVFDAFRFLPDYAEDLELGIRLIKNGHSLAFQSSNAVVHSHNRPALYFLKRNYADTVTLWNILQVKRREMPAQSILEALGCVYAGLKTCISSLRREDWRNRRPSDVVDALIRRLGREIKRIDPTRPSVEGDPMVDDFFRTVSPSHHEKMVSELYTEFRDVLNSFSGFAANYAAVCDIEKDFLNSLYKLFCLTAGYYLGANSSDDVPFLHGGV